MTPIKYSEYLTKQDPSVKPVQMMDLRDFGMQHAAPRENDHDFLTLRFDEKTGALVPST